MATIAGPGHCDAAAVPDPVSTRVRSLSIDQAGQLYIDTGSQGSAIVAKVGIDGHARGVRTGETGTLPSGSAFAPDGAGGLLLVRGDRLVQVKDSEAPLLISGTTGATFLGPPGGGPLVGVRSLASADDGNVFVAEALERGSVRTRIRFFNRGATPMTFYAGTPWEVIVPAGAVGTIAGEHRDSAEGAPRAARWSRIDGDQVSLAVSGDRLYIAWHRSAAATRAPSTGIEVVNLGSAPFVAHGVPVAPGSSATVVGGGPSGYRGDGGSAQSSSLSIIRGMAATPEGELFVADEGNHRIRRIDARGQIMTVAGSGGVGANAGGFNGNDRPAVSARLDRPFDVKVSPRGWLYISDQFNEQVRYVDSNGVIRAAVGNGIGRSWNCVDTRNGATATIGGRPGRPVSVSTNDRGEVLFLDMLSGRVRKIDRAGRVTNITSTPPSGPGCPTDSACPAVLAGPGDVLYVRDGSDGTVTVVNTGNSASEVHGVVIPPGASHRLSEGQGPGPMALDPRGELFVADRFAGALRRIDAEGKTTTLFDRASSGAPQRCCTQPSGVAVDHAGNLYVADAFPGGRIWFLNLGTAAVEAYGTRVEPGGWLPVAGMATLERGFSGDEGPAGEATFRLPGPLAVDDAGNLYIVDLLEHTVRKVDPKGVITTAAGTGTFGFNGDYLKGPLSTLHSPAAIAVDRCGNLVIADAGNDRVRRLTVSSNCEPVSPSGSRSRRSPGWLSPFLVLAVVPLALIAFAGFRGRRTI